MQLFRLLGQRTANRARLRASRHDMLKKGKKNLAQYDTEAGRLLRQDCRESMGENGGGNLVRSEIAKSR